MSAVLSLGIFSALALNLILHLALGLRGAVSEEPALPLFQSAVLFLSVLSLWTVFFYLLVPLGLGFLEYFALFPLGALVCSALEGLFFKVFPPIRSVSRVFNASLGYDGLVLAALFITLNTAASFAEALILSLGFSLGIILSFLLLRSIRRRSALEKVPPFLRGSPLTIISAAFLSLIFSAVAGILFKVLGTY